MTSGKQLMLEGLQRAANKHQHAHALIAARAWALTLGRYGAFVTSDDVKAKLEEHGVSDLGNAAGNIFRNGEWMRVGYRQSKRESAHARVIAVWRLKEYG